MLHERRHTEPPILIEAISFGFLGVLFLLASFSPLRSGGADSISTDIVIAGLCYGAARFLVRIVRPGFLSSAIHIVALMLLYSFLFKTSTLLQQSLVSEPRDAVLIALDTRIFGSEASVWMQRFVNPVLTEWMMFAYVVYIPMLPILAFVCLRSGGEAGAYDYLVSFAVVNVVCYTGFILFPVETPLWHHPGEFVVPLDGGFFTQCGEWVRANVHEKGGGLPSPHCAMATVMLAAVYRYWRRAVLVAVPVVLTLYVSTVYCRYHYLGDAVTGIAVGVLVVAVSPSLISISERMFRSIGGARGVTVPACPRHVTSEEELT